MKQYIDLCLLALLIIFMYDTPNFLDEVVNNTLGKVVCISVIMFLLYQFGNTTGILAALIYILVLHKTQEGFEKSISARREGMKEKDDEEDEEEDEEEEDEEEEDEKEKDEEEDEEEEDEEEKEGFKEEDKS